MLRRSIALSGLWLWFCAFPTAQAQLSTADLVSLCTSTNTSNQNFCQGFIFSVAEKFSTTGKDACIPDGVDLGDAVQIVVSTAQNNPQFNDTVAFQFTEFVLNSAWPCANAGILSEYSGSWFDPQRGGEGFNIEVVTLSDGTTTSPALVVYWYTYDAMARQMWLTGVGRFEAGSNTVENIDMHVTDGTDFGPNFDPANVKLTPWGTVTLTFEDCDSATGSYDSILGFGAGALTLTRLTQRTGDVCISPSPAAQ